jgi:hypothetical protein
MKRAAFLVVPLAMVVSAEAASVPTDCEQPSSTRGQAFDRQAGSGDSRAAQCLAVGLDSLDGGELEDALVALGRYGDHRPTKLLALAHQGTLSKPSLADAVRMLPLSLADNFGRQRRALEARRSRFRNVSQSTFSAERELALRSIDSALAELGRAPSR